MHTQTLQKSTDILQNPLRKPFSVSDTGNPVRRCSRAPFAPRTSIGGVHSLLGVDFLHSLYDDCSLRLQVVAEGRSKHARTMDVFQL